MLLKLIQTDKLLLPSFKAVNVNVVGGKSIPFQSKSSNVADGLTNSYTKG